MAAPSPPSPPLVLLRLVVLVMGLYGLGWILRDAALGRAKDPLVHAGLPASPVLRLGHALTDSHDERVARHLEANRVGSFELLTELRGALAERRDEVAVVGFHATAEETAGDPAAERERKSALAFLGHLQLLLHPIPIEPMPKLGPDWTPTADLPLDRLFVLDLGYPRAELFEALFEPGPGGEAGSLWLPPGTGQRAVSGQEATP